MKNLLVSTLLTVLLTASFAQGEALAARSKRSSLPPHGKLFKGKVSLRLTRAENLLMQNKFEEATEAFRLEVKRNPHNVDARAGLGMALALQFKIDGANEQFEKVLAADPANPIAHAGIAMSALNKLQSSSQTVINNRETALREAEDHARTAVQQDPQLQQAHYTLGRILQEEGKNAEAYEAYKQASVADPTYSPAFSGLGLIDLKENRVAEATANFQEAIKLNSGNSTAHYGLGETYLRQGQLDQAIKELNISMYQFRNSAPVYMALGKAYEAQGNTDAALKQYEHAVLIKPELKEAYSRMAALHVALGQQQEQNHNVVAALKEYRQASLIDPHLAQPYLRMADLRESRGDTELAIAELRNGLEVNPDNLVLHQRIGDALLKLDKYDDAIKAYQQSLRLQPDNKASIDGLTRSFYLKAQKETQGSFAFSNDYESAEATLQQAIKLHPDELQLHLALAKLRALAGKPVDLTKLGTPTNDGEKIAYAEALLAQNKFAEATGILREVIAHSTAPQQLVAVADLAVMIKDLDSAEEAYKKMNSMGYSERAARGIASVNRIRQEAGRNVRLATDLYNRKQLASAVDNYRQASFNNPKLPDARLGIAKSEERLSPKSPDALRDAAVQYRAYMSLNPNLPEKQRKRLEKHVVRVESKATKIERSLASKR